MVTREVGAITEHLREIVAVRNRLNEEERVREEVRDVYAQFQQRQLGEEMPPDQGRRLITQVRFEDAGIEEVRKQVRITEAEFQRLRERLDIAKEAQEDMVREYQHKVDALRSMGEIMSQSKQQTFTPVRQKEVVAVQKRLKELERTLNAYPPAVVRPVTRAVEF